MSGLMRRPLLGSLDRRVAAAGPLEPVGVDRLDDAGRAEGVNGRAPERHDASALVGKASYPILLHTESVARVEHGVRPLPADAVEDSSVVRDLLLGEEEVFAVERDDRRRVHAELAVAIRTFVGGCLRRRTRVHEQSEDCREDGDEEDVHRLPPLCRFGKGARLALLPNCLLKIVNKYKKVSRVFDSKKRRQTQASAFTISFLFFTKRTVQYTRNPYTCA